MRYRFNCDFIFQFFRQLNQNDGYSTNKMNENLKDEKNKIRKHFIQRQKCIHQKTHIINFIRIYHN